MATEPTGQPEKKRAYLMLQGLATPFFRELALVLTADGSHLHKVNYCGGDQHFSPKVSARVKRHRFNSKQEALPDFYRALITDHCITDILLFGDCRPIHKVAIDLASKFDVQVWVFEEGYTRPGFVTLEAGGTNSWSPLPRTPEAVMARAEALGDNTSNLVQLPNPMPARVRMDLVHHFWNIFLKPLYFRYETHRPSKVTEELGGWINRFNRKRRNKLENDAHIKLFETAEKPYFFVPLQLNSDYQIREHSPYEGTLDFIREVIASFAKNAPKGSHLMFKSHPLDNGMIDYRNYIAMAGIKHGIEDRISFLEGGDLDKFLKACEGVVLINSTVGYAALKKAKSIKTMGNAIYDIAGLTDQKPLDKFWKKPSAPDISLVADFLKVVRADSQLAGDFFTAPGIKMAAKAAAARIKADKEANTRTPPAAEAKKVEEINA